MRPEAREQLVVRALVPGAELGCLLLGEDQIAQADAPVADVDARAGDELADGPLVLAAEGAVEGSELEHEPGDGEILAFARFSSYSTLSFSPDGTLFGGRERSLEEFDKLFRSAGLRRSRIAGTGRTRDSGDTAPLVPERADQRVRQAP